MSEGGAAKAGADGGGDSAGGGARTTCGVAAAAGAAGDGAGGESRDQGVLCKGEAEYKLVADESSGESMGMRILNMEVRSESRKTASDNEKGHGTDSD